MKSHEVTPRRIRSSYAGRRIPAVVMFPDDIKAKKVNEIHWRKRLGDKYSYADVLRHLHRKEAETIEKTGSSMLDLFSDTPQ